MGVEECRHGTVRGLTDETAKTVGRHSNKDLSLGLAHEPGSDGGTVELSCQVLVALSLESVIRFEA